MLGFIYIDASAAPQPGDKRPAPTPTKKSPSSRSASRSSLDSTGGSEADLEGQLMAFEEKWTILNEWNDGRMQVRARFNAKKSFLTFGSRFQFDLVKCKSYIHIFSFLI